MLPGDEHAATTARSAPPAGTAAGPARPGPAPLPCPGRRAASTRDTGGAPRRAATAPRPDGDGQRPPRLRDRARHRRAPPGRVPHRDPDPPPRGDPSRRRPDPRPDAGAGVRPRTTDQRPPRRGDQLRSAARLGALLLLRHRSALVAAPVTAGLNLVVLVCNLVITPIPMTMVLKTITVIPQLLLQLAPAALAGLVFLPQVRSALHGRAKKYRGPMTGPTAAAVPAAPGGPGAPFHAGQPAEQQGFPVPPGAPAQQAPPGHLAPSPQEQPGQHSPQQPR